MYFELEPSKLRPKVLDELGLPARETFVIKHLEDLALLESVCPCLFQDKLSKLTFTFTVIFTEAVTSKQKLESKSLAMPPVMRMRITMMAQSKHLHPSLYLMKYLCPTLYVALSDAIAMIFLTSGSCFVDGRRSK